MLLLYFPSSGSSPNIWRIWVVGSWKILLSSPVLLRWIERGNYSLGTMLVSDAYCSTAVYTTPLTRNTSQIFLVVFDDVPVDVSVNGQRPNQISLGVRKKEELGVHWLLPGTCLLVWELINPWMTYWEIYYTIFNLHRDEVCLQGAEINNGFYIIFWVEY